MLKDVGFVPENVILIDNKKQTRLQKRIEKLEKDSKMFDYLRWTIVPKSVAKLLATPQYEHFGI